MVDMEPTLTVHPNGDREWQVLGNLHRLDGPALERPNGDRYWYQNGVLHRLDGPAVEYPTGDRQWFQNGERHRLDGPAVEWGEDGPAVVQANGTQEWWLHNRSFKFRAWLDQTALPEQEKLMLVLKYG